MSARVPLLTIVGALVALYLLLALLGQLVLTLVVAGAVYYLLAPVVTALERRVPRLAAVAASYVVLLAAVTIALASLGPRVYAQLDELAADLPGYAERVESWLLDHDLAGEGADPRIRDAVESLVDRGDQIALEAVKGLLSTLGGVFSSLFAIVLGLVAGFYLLLSAPELATAAARWFPPGHRDRWARFGAGASAVLAGYLRARVLASVFVGVSYGLAFTLLGVNEPILLGVLGGVLNLVPLVGPLLAAIPALGVAIFQSWSLTLAVLVVMVIAQQIESAVVAPHFEGRYLGLPPAVIVIVAAAGAALAGLPGLVLATPAAGIARVALDVFYRERWDEAASPRAEQDGVSHP